jgi:hypothetical protein
MELRSAAANVLAGAVLWSLGTGVAAAGLRADRSAAERASNTEEPDPSPAGQTLRDTEPPQAVGPRFDEDAALPRAAERIASYTLEARLDDVQHTVDGHGTITWKNASSRPATELYVHLYLNAFANDRTVFLRSPFGAGRSGRGAKEFGYIDVTRFAVREMGGADVWPPSPLRLSEEAPGDETDVRMPLPRPALPGETLTIDVAWTSRLPEIVERTGYVRDFHMLGQWFPKIARREPDGTWVHFPFHAQSEFYADFGSYDVTLDVADGLVVGATGVRVGETASAGRRRLRYRADDVHDFAWTAWKHFLVREETDSGVRVRLLYPPGNDANADATLRAVRHGLLFFGAAFGRYPYPVLTVVHPPAFAPAAGGMEYPTLITTGFPWYTSLVSTFVERVTLHELGHQWFYGLVATDEHSFPFLDEGLTTYAETEAMHALYGTGDGFRGLGLDIDGDAYFRCVAADAGKDEIVARPARDFPNFREIGALVYARTGTILETIARVYGAGPLRRAMGRYARRYRFEHPNPRHLLAVIREVMGDPPADFLATALFDRGTVDFVVKDLSNARQSPEAGFFDRGKGREKVSPPSSGQEPWAHRVFVYRHGTLQVPVAVELRFDDGSRMRVRLDGTDAWTAVDGSAKARLTAAVVDPDLAVLLDDDLANNAVAEPPGTSARLVERGTYAGELLVSSFGP